MLINIIRRLKIFETISEFLFKGSIVAFADWLSLVGLTNPTAASLIVSGTNFFFTIVALFFVDLGRRRMLVWTLWGLPINGNITPHEKFIDICKTKAHSTITCLTRPPDEKPISDFPTRSAIIRQAKNSNSHCLHSLCPSGMSEQMQISTVNRMIHCRP